ncbi:MAG: hypothetical protein RLZZ252_146 [Bacteroidota bacterium]
MRMSYVNYVISSCLVLAAVGCNSSENTAESVQDSLLMPDAVEEFPVADAERSFPFNFQADATMVIPGGYYDQSQAERYLKQKFYGLMLDSSTMNYSIQSINEPLDMLNSQDEFGHVGYYWPMAINMGAKCLFALSENVINKPQSTVKNLIKQPVFLTDSSSLEFTSSDRKYKINCLHTRTKEQSGLEYISKYRLILKSTDKQGKDLKKTMLSYIPFFDDGAVEILFVGDLDGDSYPDLLIDNAYKYTGKGSSVIFYSTKASKIKGMPVPVCQSETGNFQSELDSNEGC